MNGNNRECIVSSELVSISTTHSPNMMLYGESPCMLSRSTVLGNSCRGGGGGGGGRVEIERGGKSIKKW